MYFFLKINAPSIPSALALNLMQIIAKTLIYVVPVLLLWLWLLINSSVDHRTEMRKLAIKIFYVICTGIAIDQIIAFMWSSPRPFMIDLSWQWLAHAPNSSFPSTHATIFACVTVSLLAAHKIVIGFTMLTIGVLVAWARIYLGLHFPVDILGGIMVACYAYLLFTNITNIWPSITDTSFAIAMYCYRKVFAKLITIGWLMP